MVISTVMFKEVAVLEDFNLRDICHVCKNDDGDRFVGIKVDADNIAVYFPIGYQLPDVSENERDLRRDITNLILVLSSFTEQKDKLLAMKRQFVPQSVDFPVNAYMTVISDFMTRSYYTETETQYVTSDRGKVDWPKTIKRQKPLIQKNGSAIYSQFQVRNSTPNDKNLITRVHEFCVFEAFEKLGWLFTTETPRKPQLRLEGNKSMFLSVVQDKLGQTFIDTDKKLFTSMIEMLKYLDEKSLQRRYYFGTDNFEYVWERLIDKVFGIKNKRDFFPRTHWSLRDLPGRDNEALEPDTIMLAEGLQKAFVLDAKYYRYGATRIPAHLPQSSDINKQITYGEYVNTHSTYSAPDAVYNAFLMPYNSVAYDEEHPTGNRLGLTGRYEFIGEAYGDWKLRGLSYERVQGIVVDIRYLMHNYSGNTAPQIKAMVDKILEAYEYHRGATSKMAAIEPAMN